MKKRDNFTKNKISYLRTFICIRKESTYVRQITIGSWFDRFFYNFPDKIQKVFTKKVHQLIIEWTSAINSSLIKNVPWRNETFFFHFLKKHLSYQNTKPIFWLYNGFRERIYQKKKKRKKGEKTRWKLNSLYVYFMKKMTIDQFFNICKMCTLPI